MSMRTRRALAPLLKYAGHAEGLSFLYCTPTILSHHFIPSKAHPPRRPLSTRKHQIRHQHGFSARASNDIPFEGLKDFALEETERPDSTLTKQERLAFQRLNEREPSTENEDGVDDDSEVLSSPYDDLYAMFDTVIRHQETRKVEREEKQEINALQSEGKAYQDLPRIGDNLFNAKVRDKLRLRVKNGIIVREHETEQEARESGKICEQHLKRSQGRLNGATTDVEIRNILNQEMFSMVEALNERFKRDKKAATSKLKSKAPPSLVEQGSPTVSQEQRDISEGHSPTLTTRLRSSSDHNSLSTNMMLAIIQENYAQINLMALRLWRRRFAMTPYSLQILPHIKSLGDISYVLGASTGMYNEILFVKWTQYHDLHGIADLILEMVNRGLGANQLTFELLSSIDRTRKKDLAGQRGKVLRSWWILRGVKEASNRLRAIYKQLEQEAGKSRGMSYSRLQGALDDQDYGEVSEDDRIRGT